MVDCLKMGVALFVTVSSLNVDVGFNFRLLLLILTSF